MRLAAIHVATTMRDGQPVGLALLVPATLLQMIGGQGDPALSPAAQWHMEAKP